VKTYFDTSYLVAIYVPNDHTAAALRQHEIVKQEPMAFTPLHRLELRTTVRQCVYSRLINEAAGRRILRHVEEDLDDGTLVHQPLDWIESLRIAETVAQRHAWTMACRSLDLWHVAAAVQIGAERFITFDKDQFILAKMEGLKALVPR
jgi:predicted nucleic acid-binding protein